MRQIKLIVNGSRQVAIKRHEDEYQCHLSVNGKPQPAATYYTGDWDDALGTASYMVKPLRIPEANPAPALSLV